MLAVSIPLPLSNVFFYSLLLPFFSLSLSLFLPLSLSLSLSLPLAGWTPFHLYRGSTERDRNLNLSKLNNTALKAVLDKVRSSVHAVPFRNGSVALPVSANGSEHGGVDLATITSRLRSGDYYRNKEMMRADLLRMVNLSCFSFVCWFVGRLIVHD
jgi:hypothetical protein